MIVSGTAIVGATNPNEVISYMRKTVADSIAKYGTTFIRRNR